MYTNKYPTHYSTIRIASEGLYKEKGSKFLAYAYPVTSEEDIKAKLRHLRKIHFNARHHCYAYILNPDRSDFRSNDDGEPNHSAGDPILGQIHSRNLTNVLVVVVRYFGGTKLGVGGLINAYKNAAIEALDMADIIVREVVTPITINYSYECTNEVMRLISDFDLKVIDQRFEENCEVIAEVGSARSDELKNKIGLLKNTGHNITFIP